MTSVTLVVEVDWWTLTQLSREEDRSWHCHCNKFQATSSMILICAWTIACQSLHHLMLLLQIPLQCSNQLNQELKSNESPKCDKKKGFLFLFWKLGDYFFQKSWQYFHKNIPLSVLAFGEISHIKKACIARHATRQTNKVSRKLYIGTFGTNYIICKFVDFFTQKNKIQGKKSERD